MVIIRVCSNPFYEHDLMLIVNGHNQAVVIAFDVEDHPIRPDNAGIRISLQYLRWTSPACSENFMKPGIERGFDRFLVLAALEAIDVFP